MSQHHLNQSASVVPLTTDDYDEDASSTVMKTSRSSTLIELGNNQRSSHILPSVTIQARALPHPDKPRKKASIAKRDPDNMVTSGSQLKTVTVAGVVCRGRSTTETKTSPESVTSSNDPSHVMSSNIFRPILVNKSNGNKSVCTIDLIAKAKAKPGNQVRDNLPPYIRILPRIFSRMLCCNNIDIG